MSISIKDGDGSAQSLASQTFGTDDFPIQSNFYLEVARGNVTGASIVSKFGAGTIGTTLAPVTQSGTYQTPTTAVALEVVSDDAADTSAGAGAREITVIGLDASWNEQTVTVATNGLTAVALGSFTRVYRAYVSKSGTYATELGGSHAGVITIQETGGGTPWVVITDTPFQTGQSQVGAYTIPTGKRGYLLSKTIFVDSTKSTDIYFFRRDNADIVAAPYTGTMRMLEREIGLSGGFNKTFAVPKLIGDGPCDVGFMGSVSTGSAAASVEFELLLIDIT